MDEQSLIPNTINFLWIVHFEFFNQIYEHPLREVACALVLCLQRDAHIRGHGFAVVVKDLDSGDEDEYTIVGSAEADPLSGKISNESPVGAGLIGLKVGDITEIEIPDGIIKYKVCAISF